MNGPCVQQSAPLSYSLACVTCITVACGLHFSLSLRASKVGDKSNSTNYSIDTARTLFTTTFKNQPATDHPASRWRILPIPMADFAYRDARRTSKLITCTTRKLTPPPARHRRWPPPRSRGAIQPSTTCRSKSSSAASATPTSTRSATSGASSCPRSTRSSPAMRSSAASPRSARRSPSTSPATSPRSAAWSTRTAPAPSARPASSSSART